MFGPCNHLRGKRRWVVEGNGLSRGSWETLGKNKEREEPSPIIEDADGMGD